MEEAFTRASIVKQGTHPSMIRVPITIKTLVLANLHYILRASHNSLTVVSSMEVHILVLIVKQGIHPSMIRGPHYSSDYQTRNQLVYEPNPELEGSDDYTKVSYNKDKCLSDHYTAPVTPLAYTPSIPFLATLEPADTFLMGDAVISTILERENDEFIKSSIDDLVPIPRDS
ncbi:hypothetical protein Tco_0014765 [Tanacetum coccineum]